MKFDGREVARQCANIIFAVDSVPSCREPAPVLLQLVGFVCNDYPSVGDILQTILWDFAFWYEKNCVRACDLTDSLGQAAKLVGKCSEPNLF